MPKLTAIVVERLWKTGPRVPGKAELRGDGEGLYFKVTGVKKASWVFRYQLDGKRPEMGLGAFPTVGLAEAREKSREQRKLARVEKIDPLAHRQTERSKQRAKRAKQLTVRQLWEEYRKVKGLRWNPRTANYFNNHMKNHVVPVIGDILISDVDGVFANQVLAPIWLDKPALANVVRAVCLGLFEFAEASDLRLGNPFRHIQKRLGEQPEGKHFRAFPYKQIPELVANLREINTPSRDMIAAHASGATWAEIQKNFGVGMWAVQVILSGKLHRIDFKMIYARALEMMILTGTPRPSELLQAQWAEIDWDQKLLMIPRWRMKVKKNRGGAPHIIPLIERALEILRELKTISPGDYVFQGSTQGRTAEIRERFATEHPGAAGWPMERSALLYFVQDTLGLQDALGDAVHSHGFRSTFTDWAFAEKRFRPIAIELSLDHAYGNKVHRAYRHEQLLGERRELLEAWADYCDGTSADVIKLPVRKRRSAL